MYFVHVHCGRLSSAAEKAAGSASSTSRSGRITRFVRVYLFLRPPSQLLSRAVKLV